MTDYKVLSGTSTGLTLNNGDDLSVYSGGTASGTFVSSGAIALVYSGGVADQTTVASGGELVLLPGATASGTAGLYADIISSGAVVFASGAQIIEVARGTYYGPPVGLGEVEFVLPSGHANAASVSGGFEFVASGGIASGLAVSSGGFVVVSSGGSATGAEVGSGGTLIALPGADVAGSTNAGGAIISTGVAVITEDAGVYAEDSYTSTTLAHTTVTRGETAYVLSGGEVSAVVVSGTLEVFSGGNADTTYVTRDSTAIILAGGVASNTRLAGYERVSSGGVASGTNVSAGGVEFVYSGGSVVSTVLSSGGAVDLTTLAYNAGGSVRLNSGSDLLTVTEAGTNAYLQLASGYTGEYFHLTEDTAGGTLVTLNGTPCYCRGARIGTDQGEIEVENLAIGDLVITRSGQVRPIIWIGHRDYDASFAAANPEVLPILIKRDALADGVPKRDLYVSPLHALLIDGTLIPARALINQGSIVKARTGKSVGYFHLELATHDVILAEGAAAETYVDDRNRGMFRNAGEFAELYPDRRHFEAGPSPAVYCAPRCEDGPVVAAAQASLAQRAIGLGYPLADTLSVTLALGINRVVIPRGTGTLRLISGHNTPPGDRRRLGALIRRLFVGGVAIDLADSRLITGFHPLESHTGVRLRWTDGSGTIRIMPQLFPQWCKIEVAALSAGPTPVLARTA